MCATFLGYVEPQNWFNPGVGGCCIPLYLIIIAFLGAVTTCIYSDMWVFELIVLSSKNAKLRIKKKKVDLYFQICWVGRKRA